MRHHRPRFDFAPASSRLLPPGSLRRRGWTLIELVAVTTLTMVMAGSATALVMHLLRASDVQARDLVQQRGLHLWESRFREDVHLAQAAAIPSSPAGTASIELTLPSSLVTYHARENGIERRVDGKLGGRWDTAPGEWEFTLSMNERLVRAVFHQAEHRLVSESSPSNEKANLPRQMTIEAALRPTPSSASRAEGK